MRTPFVGPVRRRRQLRAPLDEMLYGPSPVYDTTIDQLCIRARALAPRADSLSILVTGTTMPAGTSTVAALVARNLAEQGADVLLVDADTNAPDLSRDLESVDPIDQLFVRGGRDRDQRRRSGSTRIAPNGHGGSLRVVGFPGVGDRAPQIVNVTDVISAARGMAHIVVVDGGPLMGSASTVLLSRECDVVVLAVPVARQRVENLRVVTSQLAQGSGHLLPVCTPSLRKTRAARPSRPATHAAETFENV
jgi:hypothetical protein